MSGLRYLEPDSVITLRREPVDPDTYSAVVDMVDAVREGGFEKLLEFGKRFGDIGDDSKVLYSRDDLQDALEAISAEDRGVLERTAARIEIFAKGQRESLSSFEMSIPGGRAGHQLAPVARAGCYAPGGRFPLPSTVLMTVITARVAGVQEVIVASPKPTPITLAAAAVAGADQLIAIGGAQVIGALTFGAGEIAPVDVIVGPGNRWVTAAKKYVSGYVGIDMLAGPSELVVWADDSVEPNVVAADLLAQAEHDPDALPVFITTSSNQRDAVNEALINQLAVLPTKDTAEKAVENGFAVLAKDAEQAAALCNRLAPEHLEIHLENAEEAKSMLDHYGALFVGRGAAEVFGDYGAGPNHVLPTGGCARFTGGLSVMTFLRMRTWMESTSVLGDEVIDDTVALARMEGLEGHARAAESRKSK
jgi:histidinol dehydrogenase